MQIGEASFDPSGNAVEFEYTPTNGSLELHIVPFSSGQVAVVPVQGNSIATGWSAADNLLVANIDGSLTRYAQDGSQVSSETLPDASVIETSADGSTLLIRARDNPAQVTYERAGATRTLALPAGTFGSTSLAPDGAHLFVETVVGVAQGYLAQLK